MTDFSQGHGQRQQTKTQRAATLELEYDKEKKTRHEVIAGIMRIMFKTIFGTIHLPSTG